MKFEINYLSDKISFRSTKKIIKKAHFAFIVSYFGIHVVRCVE